MLSRSVLVYDRTVYIFSYTHVLYANIFSVFMIWKFTDLVLFLNFLLTLQQHELYRNTKFWEDSKSEDKAQFENKQHKSDYYQQSFVFNFTKSR